MAKTIIFGTKWSVASWDARRMLEKINVEFDYIDIEEDTEAAKWIKKNTNGKLPVVILDDEIILQASTREELALYFGINLSADMLRTTTTAKPISITDTAEVAAFG